MNEFNVTDFNARPDGKAMNTEAFQQAIDACAASGGGVVYCPPGNYCLDMISLRDNVELHLERGARLISMLKSIPEEPQPFKEMTCNRYRYLIGGRKIKNAAIRGHGIIDGRGADHFWKIEPKRKYKLFFDRYWPNLHRPKGLVHFRECSNILITDVTLINPPCYTIWLLGCDNVDLQNIVIDTDLLGPNTDGIDIDCCSNVNINNCDISTGDDAIALKSDIFTLGYDKACENITVSNCRLRTTSCGVRLGYEGDGIIRNCVFSNLIMRDTMIGISMMVTRSPNNQRGMIVNNGTPIYDVIFSNIVMDVIQAINLQQFKEEPGPQTGFINNIKFRNIVARAKRGSYIGGHHENYIRGLEFTDFSMTLSGEMGKDMLDNVPDPYPLWNDLEYSGIPYAFYARYVEELFFRNLEVRWENILGSWRGAVRTKKVKSLEVEGLRTFNRPVDSEELIINH